MSPTHEAFQGVTQMYSRANLESFLGNCLGKIQCYWMLTRDNVAESDCGEGDEAEVEGGEEAPVLPLRKHVTYENIISLNHELYYGL